MHILTIKSPFVVAPPFSIATISLGWPMQELLPFVNLDASSCFLFLLLPLCQHLQLELDLSLALVTIILPLCQQSPKKAICTC
jgi:hypothetical protein